MSKKEMAPFQISYQLFKKKLDLSNIISYYFNMKLDYNIEKECCIIYLEKTKLENYSIPAIKKQILTLIEQNSINYLIFNLKGQNYLDSSSFGMFLQLQSEYKNQIEIRFCALEPKLEQCMKEMRLDSVFSIDKNEKDSISRCK